MHTLFVFGVPSPNLSGLGGRLHLSASEIVVFALLFSFSALATYGLGRVLVDVLYIYFFPFVLLWIVAKWSFKGLRTINRFCMAGTTVQIPVGVPTVKVVDGNASSAATPEKKEKVTWKDVRTALVQPFRRFTILWCFLLLVTTHQALLEIALAVVIIHVAFILRAILRVTIFSAGLISDLENRIRQSTDSWLEKIASVTRDTEATPDLRTVWTNLSGIKMGLLILQNRQLVSRWAAVLGSAFLGCIYTYLAFLFSFIYYGAAHVQSISLTWPMSFVTSLFLPFSFGDLPQNFWIKLAGGLHCVVVVAVSAGTIINYVTTKAQALQQTAVLLSQKFADGEVQTRLLILEEKFKTTTPPAASTTGN